MKKVSLIIVAGFLGLIAIVHPAHLLAASEAPAEESIGKVPVEVFERQDCKHCQDEKTFFFELQLQRDDFTVRFHDIGEKEHYDHWIQLTELEGLPKVTPITLVGNTIIEGFDSADTTGKKIEQLIDKSIGKNTLNFEEYIAAGGTGNVEKVTGGTCDDDTGVCEIEYEPLMVTIPLIGPLDLKTFSLPTISILLGFVDGFNPCAMWVLVTFLVVLAQVGDKKKMWQIAGLFIFAEAIMYYLILNVWFKAWDFVGLDNIVTPIVGIVAIAAGLFFLNKWRAKEVTCKVTNSKAKHKTSEKIKKIVDAEITFLTVIGIIGLALSVNIIEFACSIGIPQTYTKIIQLNDIGFWGQQGLMLLYILFYMIDDFIIFGIAIYSFEKIGVTTKYTRMSNFIGGILMIILGVILLLQPTILII